MRAIILAAGVGRRLAPVHTGPKALLEFAGESLLARHLRHLAGAGVGPVTVCVGHERERVETHLAHVPHAGQVTTVYNPDYRRGSVLSLWSVREHLAGEEPVLLMDADVLYGPALLRRLVQSTRANCFLLDRDFQPGEEPVKLCIAGGRLIEFRKQLAPDLACDYCGESVGFFRFEPAMAARLAARTELYREGGWFEAPYEEAIRDLLLESPEGFGFEDVTGMPWIEIDFPEDVVRARRRILPAIDE